MLRLFAQGCCRSAPSNRWLASGGLVRLVHGGMLEIDRFPPPIGSRVDGGRGARYLAAGPDGERFHRLERRTGSFRRSVGLPTAATPEMVHASVEDGVLMVLVPISHQQPGVG